ncbi:mechanosensitive ion channel family protein [Naasia aerilata]|uniref:Mechanosensitive ion channel protein MscS n=1 Tax=Naasia aerilata TaxID=1162966 RepID=A0ABN6XS38_9MICO|nr:mechanosensitive ion channel domain-containing protein [Naasia aerilata]BDZ46490.1 mechanosensitive ion channel protein MscS [Naasia aerilata]
MSATDVVETAKGFWDIWGTPIYILGVIVGAILLRIVLHFVVRRIVERIVTGVKRRQRVADTQALSASPLHAVRTVQRARTLGSVLNNIFTVVIVVVAVLLIITALNPAITGAFSLITAALGAGLGFGAQNIVRDVLNGLFLVIEDQLGVGDVVDTGQATGVVENVAIRTTQIRDVNGTLWYVRNGEILRVGNMSQGWARVIIDLAVPYDAEIDAVQERMLQTANDLVDEDRWLPAVLERPEVWGLESISSEALVIRLVIKTRTSARDDVARELRVRLKEALDEMGVKLPALNSVVLSGFDGASSVKGARLTHAAPTTIAPPTPVKKPRATRVKPKPEEGAR